MKASEKQIYGVEIYWDNVQVSVQTIGDPEALEATNRCLNAAISVLVTTGCTDTEAKHKIIAGLVNSLSNEDN